MAVCLRFAHQLMHELRPVADVVVPEPKVRCRGGAPGIWILQRRIYRDQPQYPSVHPAHLEKLSTASMSCSRIELITQLVSVRGAIVSIPQQEGPTRLQVISQALPTRQPLNPRTPTCRAHETNARRGCHKSRSRGCRGCAQSPRLHI